jgi:acyl-coenzyme A thioesterase PaaI-like protein
MTKSIFKTDRKESLRSKIKRFGFNFHPAYRHTGGRLCFLSADWKEVHIKLGLNWTTRNYVGSVFGGSIFGALDPIYMVQLINILGEEYVVWDKSATIKFIKPIKKTVFARFLITDELINEIKTKIEAKKKFTFNLAVTFQDEKESIYAESVRTIFVADKSYLNDSRKKRTHNQ